MEKCIAVIFSFAAVVFSQGTEEFDFNSCRVQLSCGVGGELPARGAIGPRGPQRIRGLRGLIGAKGTKGEPCDCDEQLLGMKQEINALTVQTCSQTKFKFRGGKATDWVRVKTPIQEITSATFCSWITPSEATGIKGSYISYSTFFQANEFLVFFPDRKTLRIIFSGQHQDKSFNITSKTHLCITIAPTLGWANVFEDGQFQFSMNPPSNRSPIEGGGNLLLGQEQDSFMGDLDANQALSGTIENLMMWYRILDDTEILALYNDPCSCPKDYAIGFTPDQIQLEGVVATLPIDEC